MEKMFRQAAKSVLLSTCSSTTRTSALSSSRRNMTTLMKSTDHSASSPKKFALFEGGAKQNHAINLAQQARTEVTSHTGAFHPDPERAKLGFTGVTATVTFGLLLGATISKNIAAFLEENELFVVSDDDDDD